MKPRWRGSITRIRAALVTDEYGTPTAERDWASATETAINGCSVQPVPGKEYALGREAIVTRWRLFAPGGTDLLATDRVRYGGLIYEVDGDVVTFTEGSPHVEAVLTRVVG